VGARGGRRRSRSAADIARTRTRPETPVTDGERLYASFGQNVGLFVYSLDGTLLWKKQWAPKAIYLDFGTASSPTVADGRVYLLQDNEEQPSIAALDAKTARNSGGRRDRHRLSAEVVVDDAVRLEERAAHRDRHDGPRRRHLLRPARARSCGGATRMSMPTASPFAVDGLLYVGTGSQGDANRRSWRSSRARAATSR
jgi:hypothetical protein